MLHRENLNSLVFDAFKQNVRTGPLDSVRENEYYVWVDDMTRFLPGNMWHNTLADVAIVRKCSVVDIRPKRQYSCQSVAFSSHKLVNI